MRAQRRVVVVLGLVVGLVALLLWATGALQARSSQGGRIGSASELELAAGPDQRGFAQALAPVQFRFPEDHGPHPTFQTEWWYYTGNLRDEAGDRYGFQLTFFRRALHPDPPERASNLAADQIYSAHLALTIVADGEQHAYERYSRGAAGLAGAQAQPYRIWLEDWSARALDQQGQVIQLRAAEGDIQLDLVLHPAKPVVAHGREGLSAKGPLPGQASYYLSFTRMQAQGEIAVADTIRSVEGLAWFDHEWGSSSLGAEAVGWDWFGLQLEDGRDLMLYQIRLQDGTASECSGGTLVLPDGSSQPLPADALRIEALGNWRSSASGATYPSGWKIDIDELDMQLIVQPLIADQELRLSLTYWEGAVRVQGTASGSQVSGFGYAELTGYLQSMQGLF